MIRKPLSAVLMACLLWLAVGAAFAFAAGKVFAMDPPADGPVRVEINIPEFTLRVFRDDEVIRTFPVGVGRPGFPTPVGSFRVISKVEHPVWENPYLGPGVKRIGAGAENPLGTRWIGFHATEQGEYGMHGTDSPETVGKLSSHGCIRMRIPDAEALYQLVSVGTPVRITYETHRLESRDGQLILAVFPDPYQRGRPDLQGLTEEVRAQYPNAVIFDGVLQSAMRHSPPRNITIGFTGSPIPTAKPVR